jgi:hypothetical protein
MRPVSNRYLEKEDFRPKDIARRLKVNAGQKTNIHLCLQYMLICSLIITLMLDDWVKENVQRAQ